jgi:YesN/AraC family two-component response regulator
MNTYLGIGGIYNTINDVPQAYSEAGRALEYRYIKKDRILYYNQIAKFFKGRSIITSDIETRIQEYLMNLDTKAFEEYILKILSDLYRGEWSDKGVLFDTCIEILLIINRYIGTYVGENKPFAQSDYNAIRALLKKESYEDVKNFISSYLREIISGINSVKEKPLGFAIENVIKYINEHYNENLTLQKLSEVVYMHPTYLSKLFKEKTGETFLEYLTKVRVDKAKKLLQNLSLRIYDVCEMVGYDSPKHFCKVFKEIEGSTPKDYRKQSMDAII